MEVWAWDRTGRGEGVIEFACGDADAGPECDLRRWGRYAGVGMG